MKVDLRITGGTLIDPHRGLHGTGDVLIRSGRIVSPGPGEKVDAERTVNARGCFVFPGLIDFHAHLFAGGNELGVNPDPSFLPMGVTTAVDAGSCGTANYDNFFRTIVATSRVRIFSFLHVCPAGLMTSRYTENADPAVYDEEAIAEVLSRHPDQLLGLKVRQSKEIVGEFGSKPLEAAVRIAEGARCRVVVHTTNPPVPPEKLISILRPGDVYCHVHHGIGESILGPDGKIRAALFRAQKSGIIFDAANGRNHFAVKVARAALAEGFFPDVISTDLTARTAYKEFAFGLPYVLMKYLNLGMELDRIISACTSVPAGLIGLTGKIGTLAPGAYGDVAVFRQAERPVKFYDNVGEKFTGNQVLIPQLTVLDGNIVYRQVDFQN